MNPKCEHVDEPYHSPECTACSATKKLNPTQLREALEGAVSLIDMDHAPDWFVIMARAALSIPNPILIHPAGTVVLCKNGHEVCEILRDLYRGDTHYFDAVGKWRSDQVPAKYADPLPLKCWCGEPYFYTASGRFEHTRPNDLTRKDLAAAMKEFIATSPNNDW